MARKRKSGKKHTEFKIKNLVSLLLIKFQNYDNVCVNRTLKNTRRFYGTIN